MYVPYYVHEKVVGHVGCISLWLVANDLSFVLYVPEEAHDG